VIDETAILKRTLAALESADVSDALKPVAFEKVFDLVAGESGPSHGGAAELTPPVRTAKPLTESPAVFERLGVKLGLEGDLLRESYTLDEADAPVLHIQANRIDASKSEGTRQIALLVAAGRQGAGIEDRTDLQPIRERCEYFGRYDANNFASHIKSLENLMIHHWEGEEPSGSAPC
jgi:hypothetical protein